MLWYFYLSKSCDKIVYVINTVWIRDSIQDRFFRKSILLPSILDFLDQKFRLNRRIDLKTQDLQGVRPIQRSILYPELFEVMHMVQE